MKIHRVLLYAFFVFCAFTSRIYAQEPSFYTSHLPEPDRAEVTALTTSPNDGPTAKLDAKAASKLAAFIRAQTWRGPAGACDKRQYLLRFYADGKLIATEGICFHCGCLAPLDPDLNPSADAFSFDTASVQAKACEAFLEKLFPGGK